MGVDIIFYHLLHIVEGVESAILFLTAMTLTTPIDP